MNFDLRRFENLGCACEFGFFLQDRGNDLATLFKWAETHRMKDLVRLIESDFENLLKLENIVPFNADMVLDNMYNIAWHTALKSEITPAGAVFVEGVARRKELWAEQERKTSYLINRFRNSIASPNTIFVFRPYKTDNISESDMLELQTALIRKGKAKLLVVTLVDEAHASGTAIQLNKGLVHGYVDRFAPGNNARDYSKQAWESLCASAQPLLIS